MWSRAAISIALLVLFQISMPAQHRDPLEYIRILESAERVKKLQVERVIQALEIPEGSIVADLGAGSGLFTRPLARAIGRQGTVYAVDIDSELLEHIEETARENQLRNIRTVLASEYDPKIPEKVDLVLIIDTLHHIKKPARYLRGLTRYLREGGRVAVIDYCKNWPKRFASAQYSVQELETWMRAAGYDPIQKFDFLEDNFFVVFRYKPHLD